jgi:hypothetical protein
VPLGLAAWIAFSLTFVFANLSYLWPVISDPFGWGWNLFGTFNVAWTPYLTRVISLLQAVTLIGGAAWATHSAVHIAGQIQVSHKNSTPASVHRLAWPVVLYCLALTASLIGLMIA